MSLTLNLGKVSVSNSSFAASTVEFGGKSYTVTTGASVGLGDNGSLSLANNVLTFVAGEGFSGALTTSGAAKGGATLKAVDFSAAGGAVSFDAKGTDVVTITGSDYNDKLLSNIDGASIDGGDGDDTIIFSGKTTVDATTVDATILGGKGDDKISVTEMATVSINDAEGDDTYVISGKGADVTIDDTKGSDNVKISGAGVNADITLAGSDDNIVLLDSVASITANISVGAGDDVITSKSSNATLDIKAGDGDNVITVAGKESEVSITAGKGDDVIDIAKGADKSTVAISVDAGDDIVKINAASVTGSVDGGGTSDDDVLVIAGANASLTVDKVETVNLTGKNGYVSVTGGIVNSSAVGATINAATVNVSDGTAVLDNATAINELNISKGSVTANTVVTATVTGGTFTSGKDVNATDTIVINGSGAVVDAGAGVDTITVSEDATGTNTLTLGDGADVVSIDAGNSKVVITDLGIGDKLTLVDASEETTATLSKTGVLNIVDAGQYNVTANVYTGDVATGADYAADIKNKAKNNVYHASVTAGDAGIIDLYTAAGTTKNVTVDASNVSAAKKTIIDLTAAKSSEVTVDATEATTIALGNGKDVVTVSGTMSGKTEISGYNFANKDVISVNPSAVVLLDKDGKLTVDVIDEDDETGVFVTTTANNNVYAAKVNDSDYYTAKTGAVKIATDKNVTLNTIDVAAAASSNINIAAGAATILALSEGADVINVAASATVDASEAVYDYADGDVINLGKATIAAGAALTTINNSDGDVIGSLTVNNVTVGVSDLNDSLYAAKVVSNNNKKTTTYATAVEDASVAIDLSASSFGDVVFDGTNATDVNVAIGAGDSVTLSDGEDVITVNGLTKNTKDGVVVSNFGLDADKLVLSNVKLADLTVDTVAASLVEINYGNKKPAANVTVDVGTISDKYVSININDTDVKAAITAGATLTLDADSKDAFFIGNGKTTTLKVSDDIENTVINLADTNKYNNIHAVSVTEDATGISIIGTGNKKVEDSIDASANVNGVQVSLGAGNKDSVTLSAGADVVWFDAKQGKDNVVTNFTYGTGENADVLNLSDVSSLDKVKFTTGTTLTVKDGSASANIAFVTAAPEEGASEIVKVQLSDGKIYNVAMDVNSEAGVALNLDDEIKVDSYVGKDVAVVLNSNDEVAYTYAKSSKEDVVAIDGSNTNGAMTIVGVENVTLGTSEEENANKVWAQGTATITATAAAGNDQVWFQSGVDKKVFVTGFADYSEDNDANDNIKLVGTKSVADIVSQYKLASKDDNVVITGVSSAASKLTVENTSTVVLTDDNGVSYVAKVGEKGDSDNFSADVQIYAGMTELSSSNIEDDTVILLDGGSSTTFALNSDYYIGSSVTKFDAAGSTGNLVIVGGKTTKNELIGGEGDDLIYGGGASNDTMQGGEGSNTFFYGANDGKDVIENITDEDTINLYSGNLVDLGYNEDKNAYIFTFEGGNTLTVNGDLAEGTMVQYAGATFVYQKDDHTFIQA